MPGAGGSTTASGAVSGDLVARVAALEAKNAELLAQLTTAVATDEFVVLDDDHVLQQVGIYRYHHPLENAAAYKDRLDDISTRMTELVRSDCAIEAADMFTYDNSLAKGRRMVRDLGRLMLRAYNAEADNSLRTLRAGTSSLRRGVWKRHEQRSQGSAP